MEDLYLSKDEEIIGQYDLSYSAIFSFAKSNFDITNKRLIVKTPNTFGIIPIGKNSSTYPLNNISRVKIDRKINIKVFLIGCLVLFITLCDFKHLFLLFLIGIGTIVASMETSISIQNNAGRGIKYNISPFEGGMAKDLIHKLNKAIADSM